jgi:vitamin B12 transporter
MNATETEQAQSAPQKTSGRQLLDDMVVTATRTQERAIDVPVTTEVITLDKIEMSGARDVGDLIGKYITGHFHRFSGLLSPVGLRGFRTEAHGDDVKGHVLILIDGHRIGTGNAAKINVDRVQRIEVIKGPASALYGSAAMGGVINLITKKGEGEPGATVSGDIGSFNYFKGQVSSQGEVWDSIRFHATASYEDIDDYEDPRFGTVYNSSMTKSNIGGNFAYALNPNHEFRLGGNFADLTGEYPSWEAGSYSSYNPANRKNYNKSHAYADLEYNGDFVGSQLHWRGLAYTIWDRNHWRSGTEDPKSDQSKYTDTTLGTDHQLIWSMTSWNKLVAGVNAEFLEKESKGVRGGQPAAPYTPGMRYASQSAFLQDSLDLWDNRINLIGALRYDRFDLKTLRPATGDYSEFNEKSGVYDHFSPKAGAGIKLFDELLRLRANVGEGFKSPSSDQLSADYTTHSGVRFLGNPNLKPETSLSVDAGLDIYHSDFTFRASYFHTYYNDKIVKEETTVDDQTVNIYKNHGKAQVAGIEVALEWWLNRTFDWGFDLSLWSNTVYHTVREDKETGEDLLYISDYEAKSGLDIGYRGLGFQLSYVLVGPQMVTNYDSDPSVDEKKGQFDFWDLSVRYRFEEHWEVRASVLNLLNERVEWVRGFLMPRRNVRLAISYSI